MKIHSSYMTVMTADGEMDVFVAGPEGTPPFPVLIVFQEAFGVNDHIKEICQRYAQEGYFAFAPEFYHRRGKYLQFPYSGSNEVMIHLKHLTEKDLLEDIRSLINQLSLDSTLDIDRIATVGYCVGGYISVLASLHFKFKACISYYGAGIVYEREGFGLKPLLPKFSKNLSPLLFFFGDKDSSIPQEEVQLIKKNLETLNVHTKCVVFQGAKHGFFCDQRGSYHPRAAQESWDISLEFLRELIK